MILIHWAESLCIGHMDLDNNTSILASHETIDLSLRKNCPLKPVTWRPNRAISNVALTVLVLLMFTRAV